MTSRIVISRMQDRLTAPKVDTLGKLNNCGLIILAKLETPFGLSIIYNEISHNVSLWLISLQN